jgi:hypothetical protein
MKAPQKRLHSTREEERLFLAFLLQQYSSLPVTTLSLDLIASPCLVLLCILRKEQGEHAGLFLLLTTYFALDFRHEKTNGSEN